MGSINFLLRCPTCASKFGQVRSGYCNGVHGNFDSNIPAKLSPHNRINPKEFKRKDNVG
jgi:hypothetical protein